MRAQAGRTWAYREDAARGAVRGGAAARLVSPHDVAGAAQPVQGDRCVLEEVDELGVLLALVKKLRRAWVAVDGHLAGAAARAYEPVEVSLDRQARFTAQREHFYVAQATAVGARAHRAERLAQLLLALLLRRCLAERVAAELEERAHELGEDLVDTDGLSVRIEHGGTERGAVEQRQSVLPERRVHRFSNES